MCINRFNVLKLYGFYHSITTFLMQIFIVIRRRSILVFVLVVVIYQFIFMYSTLTTKIESLGYQLSFTQNDIEQTNFTWSLVRSSVPGICGQNKCFFQAKDVPTHGYIVAYSGEKTNVKLSWERAKMLEEKYDTRHFQLSPPGNVMVSRDLFKYMKWRKKKMVDKNVLYNEIDVEKILKKDKYGNKRNYFVAQKMKRAPEPHLEWLVILLTISCNETYLI